MKNKGLMGKKKCITVVRSQILHSVYSLANMLLAKFILIINMTYLWKEVKRFKVERTL